MNLVTLLTDFGTRDYFVGTMKGAVLGVNPAAQIVDLTHETPPHNIRSAAFTLSAAYSTFPNGTIHVAVVDPGVGSERRALIAVTEKHLFVAPDNGVLSFVFENEPDVNVFEITSERFFRQPVSSTFHGRDVFAPVAGALSRGVLPEELGEVTTDFVRFESIKPKHIDAGAIQAEVIHIDRFGNCVTNLKRDDLERGFESFELEIGGHKIEKVQKFYAEAAGKSDVFMIFGSAGFLEIVAFELSAEKLLQVAIGEQVLVKRK